MSLSLNTTRRVVSALLLSCASFSAVAADSDEAKFPPLDRAYLKTGAFVSPGHIQRIRPGLTKDQVRLELGNPHFNEGLFVVREWNYAFNFYTGKDNAFVTCQFKVGYDADGHVTSTRWKTPDCEAYIHPAAIVDKGSAAGMSYRQNVNFAADGLFVFGKYALNDLTPSGREKIDNLLGRLTHDGVKLTSIVVTGHTDRIGSETANFTLSKARAETIRRYLAQQGLDVKLIRAYGAGASQPLLQCPARKVTPQLVQCLQPNRRVEIEVMGEK